MDSQNEKVVKVGYNMADKIIEIENSKDDVTLVLKNTISKDDEIPFEWQCEDQFGNGNYCQLNFVPYDKDDDNGIIMRSESDIWI